MKPVDVIKGCLLLSWFVSHISCFILKFGLLSSCVRPRVITSFVLPVFDHRICSLCIKPFSHCPLLDRLHLSLCLCSAFLPGLPESLVLPHEFNKLPFVSPHSFLCLCLHCGSCFPINPDNSHQFRNSNRSIVQHWVL